MRLQTIRSESKRTRPKQTRLNGFSCRETSHV